MRQSRKNYSSGKPTSSSACESETYSISKLIHNLNSSTHFDVIWTRNLLIWSQTRYHCATKSGSNMLNATSNNHLLLSDNFFQAWGTRNGHFPIVWCCVATISWTFVIVRVTKLSTQSISFRKEVRDGFFKVTDVVQDDQFSLFNLTRLQGALISFYHLSRKPTDVFLRHFQLYLSTKKVSFRLYVSFLIWFSTGHTLLHFRHASLFSPFSTFHSVSSITDS